MSSVKVVVVKTADHGVRKSANVGLYLVLLGTSHFGLDFLDFVHSRHVGYRDVLQVDER